MGSVSSTGVSQRFLESNPEEELQLGTLRGEMFGVENPSSIGMGSHFLGSLVTTTGTCCRPSCCCVSSFGNDKDDDDRDRGMFAVCCKRL